MDQVIWVQIPSSGQLFKKDAIMAKANKYNTPLNVYFPYIPLRNTPITQISVQPMTAPTGIVFHLDFKYGAPSINDKLHSLIHLLKEYSQYSKIDEFLLRNGDLICISSAIQYINGYIDGRELSAPFLKWCNMVYSQVSEHMKKTKKST